MDTPLRAVHERLGATMTDFAGWLMPLRYGSETAEHNAVRSDAALFDLSHMGEIAVAGPGAGAALDYALVGWLSRLAPGRARYTMLCAPDGGILDDLVVYRQSQDRYLVVANAANTAVVLRELQERVAGGAPGGRSGPAGRGYTGGRPGSAGRGCTISDETADTALIAIQGPNGSSRLAPLTSLDLGSIKYYAGAWGLVAGRRAWVARTGYTGEDGFEIFCAPPDAEHIWDALAGAGPGSGAGSAPGSASGSAPAAGSGSGGVPAAGVPAAGLAARDTLRLEAGMPLYGSELGPDVTPYEAGLGRVVKPDKPGDFVGREALAERAAELAAGQSRRTLIGLVSQTRRVPRHGYAVLADGRQVGSVTSGAPSPTLGRPIAMAYVEASCSGPFWIDIRGKEEPAIVTKLPFYQRKGR